MCVSVLGGSVSTPLYYFPGEKVGFKGDLKQMSKNEAKYKKRKKGRKPLRSAQVY